MQKLSSTNQILKKKLLKFKNSKSYKEYKEN